MSDGKPIAWTVVRDDDGSVDHLHVARPDWVDIERMDDGSDYGEWCLIIRVDGHTLYFDLSADRPMDSFFEVDR